MKRKRFLLALCLPGLLSSCSLAHNVNPKSSESQGEKASSSGEEGADDFSYYSGSVEVSETYGKAKVYAGALNSYKYLPCVNFNFATDVPYVAIKDYYASFFNSLFGDFFRVEGNEVSNRNTGAFLRFDVDSNSIWSADFDQFANFTGTSIPVDAFNAGDGDTDPLSSLHEEACAYEKGRETTFELGNYHAQLVRYEGDVYAPFSYLDTITCLGIGYRFVWNGSDFYLCDPSCLYADKALTPYGEAFCSGSLSSYARSQSFADYNYYSFLFEMRNFYGRFDSLGISSLELKLESLGLKSKLTSRLPSTADSAIAEALAKVFADGGHTYFKNRGFGCRYSYSADYELQGKILEDSRYSKGMQAYNLLDGYRELNGIAKSGLYMKGETALIVFDEFSLNAKGASPTKKNVSSDETSTFAIFYNAFKNIANHSIKNVVFDVSMNGGGAAIALGHALSFLTDDPISLNMKNPHTGAIFKEVISIDNDFDGDAEDTDSYAGKYDFYILTSPYSFSCGNAFPCLAKENGWAKIIGKKSGGGDCIVSSGVSPDGTIWSMSGNTALIHADGSSFDAGAEVDYDLDYSSYYDLSKLDSFLCSK